MTDQTESEYERIAATLEKLAHSDGPADPLGDGARAIRALEAKVREGNDALFQAGLAYADLGRGSAEHVARLRADRDRLEAKVLLRDQHIEMLRADNALYLIDRDQLVGEVRSSELAVVSLTKALGDEQDRTARLTSELSAIRAERSTMDCRYAGQYWEASGSHCPIDKPCVRCERDRLREEYDILECNLANDGVLALRDRVARLTAELAAAREEIDGHENYLRSIARTHPDLAPSIEHFIGIDAARSAGGEG